MSEFAKQIADWYHDGYYKKKWVRNLTKKGRLTQQEYKIITGEDYTA